MDSKGRDVLIASVTIVSALVFIIFTNSRFSEGVHPIDLSILEGKATEYGYRPGEAVMHVLGNIEEPWNCTAIAEIRRRGELLNTSNKSVTIAKGTNEVRIPLILPNGNNRVVAHLECL